MMGIEIERRFLVFNVPKLDGIKPDAIVQGYLSRDKGATVRVRQVNLRDGFLTVKGPKTGATGAEFEYPIPAGDLSGLLELCKTRVLTKHRYGVPGPDNAAWELDIFTGRHAGLVITELELDEESVSFIKPEWLGPEITGDKRFSNANLTTVEMDEIHQWVAEYQGRKAPPPMTPRPAVV